MQTNTPEPNQPDLDEQLAYAALLAVHTPACDLMKGIENKMRRPSYKKTAVATIAAVMILASAAVAATITGGFDRLRDIVGPERAGQLTPVEIATTSPGQQVMYDGIRVELVAKDIRLNVADVYFTLEDTRSNRLDGDFQIEYTVYDPADPLHLVSRQQTTEEIHRSPEGIITIRARHQFDQEVEDRDLQFSFFEILFETQDEQDRPLGINLPDHLQNSAYQIYQYENPNPWGSAMQILSIPFPDFDPDNPDASMAHINHITQLAEDWAEAIRTQGVKVLAPDTLNHSMSPYFKRADARAAISSIGVIDGRLHVQVASPIRRELSEAGWEGFSHVALHRGTQAELDALLARHDAYIEAGYERWEINIPELWDNRTRADMLFFHLDPYGNKFYPNTMAHAEDGSLEIITDPRQANSRMMIEHIFDIDLAEIDQYILVGHTFSYQTLPVRWTLPLGGE